MPAANDRIAGVLDVGTSRLRRIRHAHLRIGRRTALTHPFSRTQDDQAQMNPGYLNPNAVKRLGPVDPEVTVLSVQSADGQPIVPLANYSTHYAGSPAVSADYVGVFCEKITRLIGAEGAKPPFVAMMANRREGYLPPPEQFKLGGYTTWRARTSCLEVEAETKIPAVVLELLAKE